MKYGIHPSKELVHLFSEKPYQGANPADSKILIIGNDANYSPEISNHRFFERVLEYHEDGVLFWKNSGRHHPFLLDEYPFDRRKGGVKYHRNFSKLGFGPEFASHFSFVELLNIPTTGNTGSDLTLFYKLLDKRHLNWLEDLILRGNKKFIVVNQTLVSLIGKINKKFDFLGDLSRILMKKHAPSIASETPNMVLYNGYSFSHSITRVYTKAIKKK